MTALAAVPGAAGSAPSGPLEAMLTGGDPRRLHNVEVAVVLARDHPSRLDELFECLFCADQIVRMRAGDALEKVCRANPGLLRRFVPRLLGEVSRIRQPSVQWHLAQILGAVHLDPAERSTATILLERNLDTYDDWIVTNLTLQTLAGFARTDPALRTRLVDRLHRYLDSDHKSVAARSRRLLAHLDKPPRKP